MRIGDRVYCQQALEKKTIMLLTETGHSCMLSALTLELELYGLYSNMSDGNRLERGVGVETAHTLPADTLQPLNQNPK